MGMKEHDVARRDLLILLNKIREKPKIFIGEVSLEPLRHLVNGYALRVYDETGEYFDLIPGFQSFVANTYNDYSSRGYEEIIRRYCESDEQAFYKFFELLDEFLKNKKEQA